MTGTQTNTEKTLQSQLTKPVDMPIEEIKLIVMSCTDDCKDA